jgi:hypothetical protein
MDLYLLGYVIATAWIFASPLSVAHSLNYIDLAAAAKWLQNC